MRCRDTAAVSALRSALSAIDNAEAVPTDDVETASFGTDDSPIAGAAIGAGATEAARRELTPEDVRALLHREVEERREASTEVEADGHRDRAEDLRREAAVLDAFLGVRGDTIEA
ncbi:MULTISPECIES: GatB/YqeY domain-containing protein [unclassified Knoellia]|uniref:GatB/YqeY domain-containing protein n=1 Tax=Knoellia altitudinis TaxID=3404795 RepID=UPI00361B19D1